MPCFSSPSPQLFITLTTLTTASSHRPLLLMLVDKSSKAGKDAQLLRAGLSAEQQLFLPEAEEKALFFDSLVTNVGDGDELLSFEDAKLSAPVAAAQPLGDDRDAPLSISHSKPLAALDVKRGPGRFAVVDASCPHADLFNFVLSAWASKSGSGASARSYSEEHGGRLTVSLGPDNRWCDHVQRHHRSNSTYLRISRCRQTFAQFCFDPDCRAEGFRGSSELPIPPELCSFEPDAPAAPSPTYQLALRDQFGESEDGILWEGDWHEDGWAQQAQQPEQPEQPEQPQPQKLISMYFSCRRAPVASVGKQSRGEEVATSMPQVGPSIDHPPLPPPPLPPNSVLPPPLPQPSMQTALPQSSMQTASMPVSHLAVSRSDVSLGGIAEEDDAAELRGEASIEALPPPPPPPQLPPRVGPPTPPEPVEISQPPHDKMQAGHYQEESYSYVSKKDNAKENKAVNDVPAQGDERRGKDSTVQPAASRAHQNRSESTRGGALSRLKPEQRRLTNGLGRTPKRDEVTPRRGREHPVTTPSPLCHDGMRGERGLFEGISPRELPIEALSLFGSPLVDFPRSDATRGDVSHMQTTPNHIQSAPNTMQTSPDVSSSPGNMRSSSDDMQSSPTNMHASPDLKTVGRKLQAASGVQDDGGMGEGWACAACTLVNAHNESRCAVCDALRGCTLASAATLALQQKIQPARPAVAAKVKKADSKGVGSRQQGRSAALSGRTAAKPSLVRGQTSILGFMRAQSQEGK